MAVLRIHTIPGDEAFLRQKAIPVTSFGAELRAIAADMTETLPVAKGIGLAAPQVGHSIRMVLIDISAGGKHANSPLPWEGAPPVDLPEDEIVAPPPFFLVNPRILRGEGTAGLAEGCLSAPGIRVEIPRMGEIEVEAQTLEGKAVRFAAEDLLAIVIQHELDHIDGRLIVDWAAEGCKSWREDEVPADREILD